MSLSGSKKRPTNRLPEGRKYVLGIDEVGLGAWAGPLCLGGVLAPRNFWVQGVRDSKQMTVKARKEAIDHIYTKAIDTMVVLRSAEQIICDGHSESWGEAVLELVHAFAPIVEDLRDLVVVVDGLPDFYVQRRLLDEMPEVSVIFEVCADDHYPHVSAASVVAKVFRDDLMEELHVKHPYYSWVTNKGYGTKLHKEGLISHGSTQYHRAHARKHWPVRTIS